MKYQGSGVRALRRVGVGALVAAVIMVAAAGTAWAHVVVQPGSLPKGTSDAMFSFSVPNETTTNAHVTRLEVDFPTNHPLLSAYVLTQPGWNVAVETAKLAKPVTTDDGTITVAVSKITWTATGAGIPPQQFGLFTVLAGQLPSNTGSVVFKALQTYSDGSIVRWIELNVKGAPAPEHPAPTLQLTGKAKKK